MSRKKSVAGKIISTMLAAAMILTAGTGNTFFDITGGGLSASAADTLTYGDFEYQVSDDGTYVKITKYTGNGEIVIIPDKINGLKVGEIGDRLFYNCKSIKSIVIPNGVTSIGSNAFSDCTSLTSVTIPDSVSSIGNSAFYYCPALVSVKIPEGITSIEDCTFFRCEKLTSITIPDSVTSIGRMAFYGCKSLTSVKIPKNVNGSFIGNEVFAYCTSLTSINVDAENTSYASYDGILCDKQKSEIIACPGGKENVTIPDSIVLIDEGAFEGCHNLKSVTIPDSVEDIEKRTFVNCTALESVEIPDSVTVINDNTFDGCQSLKSAVIPDSVKRIGSYAFKGCEYLTIYGTSGSCAETYAHQNSISFKAVSKGDISDTEITLAQTSYTYDGTEKCPIATVRFNGEVISSGYSVSYSNNINAGTANVTVKGTGEYTGSAEKTFTINPKSIKLTDIVLGQTAYNYDGSIKAPSVTVTDGTKTLLKDTDYTVTYSNNNDVGTAKVTIKGKGNYKDIIEKTFTINARSLKLADISLSQTSYNYDGNSKTPSVTVTDDTKTLVKDTDYTVTYSDNKNAGTAKITIKGKGNYKDTVEKTFTISAKSLKLTDIAVSSTDYYYEGELKVPALTVTDGTKTLVKDTDYTVTYSSNADTGALQITVKGKGNYKDTVEKTYTQDKKSITNTKISLSTETYVFNGSAKKPSVTVTDGTKTLVKDTDYTVTYSDNKNAGTAKVTVKGIGNYKDSAEKTFTITPKSISGSAVTTDTETYVFNGSVKKPSVTVTDGTKTLVKDTDYTVTYSDNKNAGTAKVTVKGIGNYKDSAEKTFTITPKSISGSAVTTDTETYVFNGSTKKPSVTVTDGTKTLVKDTDYTVTYSDNKNAGTAKVTVKGIGNYKDSAVQKFTITPKSVKSLTIKLSSTSYTYDGKPKLPSVTVTDGTKTLVQDDDYTITYKNNTNAGTASVIITGENNYGESVTKTFTIISAEKKEITSRMVTINPITFTYDHKIHKPAVKVIDGKIQLEQGKDYDVTYSNTVNAGTGTVTIEGTGDYKGTVTRTFTIQPKSISDSSVTFETKMYEYNGRAKRPEVTVKNGIYTLTRGTDYSVSYENNTEIGVATVRISGKNNYKGELCADFAIIKPKSSFDFGSDNWGFINASYNGDFNDTTYDQQINSTYKNILRQNLSNSEYQTVFLGDDKNKSWLAGSFAGSCYGMSSIAWLAEAGFVNFSDYKNGAAVLHDLDKPSKNTNISSLITYYQLLQVKGAAQQQYRTVPNRTNKDNIQKIISLLDSGNNVLIGYKQKDIGGHSVMAYGYETGISQTIDGVTYNGCIKVYDPNFSQYAKYANIYFNSNNNYNWFIREHGSNGISSSKFDARFNYISADISEINNGGILSFKNNTAASNKFVARIDAPNISNNRSVSKVIEKNGSYMNHSSDGDIIEDYAFINAGSSKGTVGYNLYDPDSSYKVEQDNGDILNLGIDYEYCDLSAYSAAGKSVIFDKKGYISLESESAEFMFTMTWDDEHPTDWFTIQVSGDNVNEASLLRKNKGYILKADNLKNVKIRMNNKDESTSAGFSTKYKSVYIYETDDKKIGLKVDADGNGTHEKSISAVELLENLASVSKTEIVTGESIKINVSASGGTGNYNYAVWYKQSDSASWKTKQSYSTNSVITFKPAYTGVYDISVAVRDESGKVTKKYFTLKVNDELQNVSTISSKSISLGSSVTINARGFGGMGGYTYGVWYKKDGEDTWKTKQNYSDKSKITFKPASATKYYLRVKVKDGRGKTSTKTFTLTVKK